MATFRGKDDEVQSQQLKVQELTVRKMDTHLYVVDGADVVVRIKEPLSAIVSCMFQDDSAAGSAGLITKAASALTIVDKDSPYGAGGDASAIRVAAVTLDTNDLLHIKYIAQS